MNRTIALLTDFGLSDNYIGVMKAVIKKIAPNAEFIDITHAIQPQNIKQAAFVLKNSFDYFPEDTIFIVVVDPEVGTDRKAICVQTDTFIFLAPDNGVLSYALKEQEVINILNLDNENFQLPNKSNTFHGRDIFASVAGHICNGVDIAKLGTTMQKSDLIKIPDLYIRKCDNRIEGEIIYSDRFGNIISSIHERDLDISLVKSINIGDAIIEKISKTYSEVSDGEFLTYIGSSGYLEIGVRNGSAFHKINIENIFDISIMINFY